MLAIVHPTDGAIHHIDSHLLRFLGYEEPFRPSNIRDIIPEDLISAVTRWESDFSRRRRAQRRSFTLFNVDIRRRDGSSVLMGVTMDRVAEDTLQVLFVQSDLREVRATRAHLRPLNAEVPHTAPCPPRFGNRAAAHLRPQHPQPRAMPPTLARHQ
jgi:hypothetical protein